jgi:hypothetical protein
MLLLLLPLLLLLCTLPISTFGSEARCWELLLLLLRACKGARRRYTTQHRPVGWQSWQAHRQPLLLLMLLLG